MYNTSSIERVIERQRFRVPISIAILLFVKS